MNDDDLKKTCRAASLALVQLYTKFKYGRGGHDAPWSLFGHWKTQKKWIKKKMIFHNKIKGVTSSSQKQKVRVWKLHTRYLSSEGVCVSARNSPDEFYNY